MSEKLIEKLRCCVDQIRCGDCRYVKDCDGDRMMMSQAADAIEELSNAGSIYGKAWTLGYDAGRDENKPQWIPVTQRLPEKDIEVLVFAEGKIEGFFGDTVIAISKRYDFKIFTDSEGVEVWQSPWQYFLTDYEITHWMPLPQPPKEETC